jgi:hypothetical protein
MGAQRYVLAIVLSLVAHSIGVAVLAQPRPSFEVASIKRNLSLEGGSTGIQPGGRFYATNAPVFWLIMNAYGQSQRTLLESQVVGAPNWCGLSTTISSRKRLRMSLP